jgi:hypothetical protein
VARRSLVDGLKKVDRRTEQAFIKGDADIAETEEPKPPKRKPEPKQQPKEKREGEEPTPATTRHPISAPTGRMPLTSRLRADVGTALKRASLERQLSGEKPSAVQFILDEALEHWLKDKGFLK